MIDGRLRFDNYAVGPANRLAVSAARAVVESPGAVYNPLFICSGSGLGKTHLMAAIGNGLRAQHPGLEVELLSLDDLVDQLNAAVAAGHADAVKRRWQSAGALLLDDVQFLTGRAETQSELLRMLNALQRAGRQIVMTSDRPPREIDDADARLLSRLAGGLTVDIGVPDFEMRVAILRHKCAERQLELPATVLDEIARPPWTNVRELQGALNRVVAQQAIGDVTGPPVDGACREPQVVPAQSEDEFESFLSDVAAAVAESVESWRVQLTECIERWDRAGFRTAMLARVLAQPVAPDVEALDARFAAACERLRAIEEDAVRLNPALAGHPSFRDPDRLADAEALLLHAYAAAEPPPCPDPRFTIDRIVGAPTNLLALRIAATVIDRPGADHNPLVLTGAGGAGKTHLLHAIGNALAARSSPARSWTVACVDVESWTQQLIAAMQTDTVDRWRARYRSCDALLIDDLHLLSGKERAQEELFHLFNAMHDAGKQVVFASALSPSKMTDVAARLRSRLDGGLTVDVGCVPEAERVARHTPVSPGDEAAAPTIDLPATDPIIRPLPGASVVASSEGLVDEFFLDPEKVVTDWPGPDGRIVETVP